MDISILRIVKQIVYYHQAIPLYAGFYNPFYHFERILFYYKFVYPYVMKSTWANDTILPFRHRLLRNDLQKHLVLVRMRINTFFPDMEK